MEKNTRKQTIKAVIFDLDGTLLDTEALSDQAILDSFGSEIPQSYQNTLKGRLPWEIKSKILGLRGSEWIPMIMKYAEVHWEWNLDSAVDKEYYVKILWKKWESRLNELCANVMACPGALDLVNGLSKLKIPMAIATSSRLEAVNKKRTKHEQMFAHITHIVTGDDPAVKNGKPAPDIYIEASKRLGVHPSECLVFEDALQGAKSGHSAGCQVVAVPDSRCDKLIFEPFSSVVLDSLSHFDGTIWDIDLNLSSLKQSDHN